MVEHPGEIVYIILEGTVKIYVGWGSNGWDYYCGYCGDWGYYWHYPSAVVYQTYSYCHHYSHVVYVKVYDWYYYPGLFKKY